MLFGISNLKKLVQSFFQKGAALFRDERVYRGVTISYQKFPRDHIKITNQYNIIQSIINQYQYYKINKIIN